MIYDIYVNRKPLATKYNIQDAIKLIEKVFVPRSTFMVIEKSEKSQFPIIFIQCQEDLEEVLLKYNLTNPKKYGNI